MIRLFIISILFILYGNFNIFFNDIIIFSLINIAFFTIISDKNIKSMDILLLILSTFIVEVLWDFNIIGFVVMFFLYFF